MKRLYIILLSILTVNSLFAQAYTGKITFVSNEVRQINDSLSVHFKVDVRAGVISDCNSMRITPMFLSGDSVAVFPYILITGKKRYQLDKRWESLNGNRSQYDQPYMSVISEKNSDTLLSYKYKVPYQLWMDTAQFIIRQEESGCGAETRLFTITMNNKVSTQSHIPYRINPLVAYTEPKAEQKIRRIQGQAYLDFWVGQSTILPGYRRNPQELAKIEEQVGNLTNNPDVKIRNIYIQGYASPEGLYATNDRLSYARAISLKNYLKSNFKLPEELFRVNNVAEDWDELKILLAGSNIPEKEKVMEIIDDTDIFDGRELKLMKLSGGVPYIKMKDELFPLLRRSEYQIDISVKAYTSDEAKKIQGEKEWQLNQQELYRVALSYGKESKEFLQILAEKIPEYYPDDETANSNAAAALITIDELSLAKLNLSKAADSPAVLNNLGVIFLKEGKLDEAEKLLQKASKGGIEEANHNLQELQLKRDDNQKLRRYRND